ncbi:MAG: hypothetical protein AAFR52_10750, partial [Pseudomonadota bacterium]
MSDPDDPARAPLAKRLEWFFTALPKLGDTFRRAKIGWRRIDALEARTEALTDDRAHGDAALEAALDAALDAATTRLDIAETGLIDLDGRTRDTADALETHRAEIETALARLEVQTQDRAADLDIAFDQMRRSLDRLELRLQNEIAADQARSAAERAITARAYGDLTRRVDLLRFQGQAGTGPAAGPEPSTETGPK